MLFCWMQILSRKIVLSEIISHQCFIKFFDYCYHFKHLIIFPIKQLSNQTPMPSNSHPSQQLLSALEQAEQFITTGQLQKAHQILIPLIHKKMLNCQMLKRVAILLVHHHGSHESAGKYFEEYFRMRQESGEDGGEEEEGEFRMLYAQYLEKNGEVQKSKQQYEICLSLSPSDPAPHYRLAIFLINNYPSSQSQQAALSHLQTAIHILETHPDQNNIEQTHKYYIQYARLLANSHNHQKALTIYKQVLFHLQSDGTHQKIQESIEYNYQCGIIQKYLGNYTSAAQLFQKCIALQQANNIVINPYHLLSNAETLMLLNENDSAMLNFQKCLQIIPDDVDTLRKYGILLNKMGKHAMAMNIMDQCIRLEPNHINNYYNYVLLLLEAEKIPKSLQVIEKALARPNLSTNLDLLHLYAYIQIQYFENYQQALAIYKKCRDAQPNSINNLYNYAKILLELEKYHEAEQIFKELLTNFNEETYDKELYEKVISTYGVLLTQTQRFQQAEERFNQCLERNPNSSETFYNYGLMLCNMKRFTDAHDKFQSAHEIQPENPLFILMLGIVYYQLHEYDQAKIYFGQASKLLNGDLTSSLSTEPRKQGIANISKNKFGLKAFQVKFIKENLNYYMEMLTEYDKLRNKKGSSKKSRELSTSTNSTAHSEIEVLSNNFVDLLSSVTFHPKKIQTQHPQPQWKVAMQQMKQEMMKQIRYLHEENKQLKRELTQRIVTIQQDVIKLKSQLLWNEGLDRKLELLELQRRMRAHSYGRKMCWMLCSSIQAYRSLKLGIVSAGSDVILSKTGGFIQKVGSVCDFVSDISTIGEACGIISKIAGLYVSLQQDIVIQKVIQVTNKFYQERLLSKAATQTVQYLLQDPRHIDLLENPKENESIIGNFIDFLSDKKDQIMCKMLDINLKEDQKQALVDCAVIIAHLIKIDNDSPSENTLKTAARAMLAEKLYNQGQVNQKKVMAPTSLNKQPEHLKKNQILTSGRDKKVPVATGGCCTGTQCSIM